MFNRRKHIGLDSGFNSSPLAQRRTSGGGGVYSDTTALHEWHYLNATEVGTTVTYPDTGSVGGLNMFNPDVASKPTIASDGIVFDGIANAVTKSVTSFRPLDATGEIVTVYKLLSGTSIGDFVVQDSSVLITHFFSQINLNTYRANVNTFDVPPRRSWRGSTNINNTTTFYTVTYGCTGTSYYIIVSGNNETITMVVGATNDGITWTNDFAANLISIAGLFRTGAANVFANIKHKYANYRPYTSIAESIAKNIEINTNVNV